MAILQFRCPETGAAVELGEISPDANLALSAWSRPIPCPHCGKTHAWTSGDLGQAMTALRGLPDATRVLLDGGLATALS
jgi:endogenous inhibitor of DNA gyrase (YacG/DUF329 family)